MTASFWMVAALACAQPAGQDPGRGAPDARRRVEEAPSPRPASSRISAVTVYQGQALVTREVVVPEGDGTVELVVTPLPAEAVDTSLYAEGTEAVRVLSTRFRTRAVKADTRREVRLKEEQIKTLQGDADRLQKEVVVQGQDLQFLQKLEGFTGTSLTGLTEKGRLDSEAVLALSKFIMENRGTRTKAETDLRQKSQAVAESIDFARKELAELSSGKSRTERDAVIVAQRVRREAGVIRLGYLVNSARWSPQYRLRGAAERGPVRLEYLAAVVQQTGEDWPGVRVMLSNARPSLDAAPPELVPLKIALPHVAGDPGPVDVVADDGPSRRIVVELEKLIDMPFPDETPFEDVLKYVRKATSGPAFPEGIPIYVDPVGLQEAEKTSTSPVSMDLKQVPLKSSLDLLLRQLGLTYRVKGGVLRILSESSEELSSGEDSPDRDGAPAGWAGMGLAPEQQQAAGGGPLNREAANDQAEELRVADGPDAGRARAEKDGPGVTFSVAGRLDIPSRKDPQLLEVARAELPAEEYAKAVPVLTPRVYRLARVTNKSEFVLLPGEATVYVGNDFVGRMRLPLVAAGEPFVVGFGVDPQLQVSRRLAHKSRAVQGGNQVYTYEFRLGVRNYRAVPVKLQLWDRLPRPEGEALAVNLVKTSVDLCADAIYQRTSRMDNLLRWDLDVPAGTVGDKTIYLTYEFRLEYARGLPQPQFLTGGLREAPIGGGAMGGMGGMGMGGMGFH